MRNLPLFVALSQAPLNSVFIAAQLIQIHLAHHAKVLRIPDGTSLQWATITKASVRPPDPREGSTRMTFANYVIKLIAEPSISMSVS